jgi:hypothetical protein
MDRTLLFLFGCMGTRLALVFLARQQRFLRPLGFLALAISIGFMYIWANGLRTTGIETGGERIWWNDLRPVHSMLYGLFAFMALNNMSEHAWKVLLLDVTIGFAAWLQHHAMQ